MDTLDDFLTFVSRKIFGRQPRLFAPPDQALQVREIVLHASQRLFGAELARQWRVGLAQPGHGEVGDQLCDLSRAERGLPA